MHESFDLFSWGLTSFADTTIVSYFGITLNSDWVLVLWEGAHLSWDVGCIEFDNTRQADSVSKTVWNMEFLAEFVGQGVTDTKESIGEGHTGKSGSMVHSFT